MVARAFIASRVPTGSGTAAAAVADAAPVIGNAGCEDMSKKEERCQNPKPKTRKPNPNPREENGKKKRTGREKGKRIFPYPKTDASLTRRTLDFDI